MSSINDTLTAKLHVSLGSNAPLEIGSFEFKVDHVVPHVPPAEPGVTLTLDAKKQLADALRDAADQLDTTERPLRTLPDLIVVNCETESILIDGVEMPWYIEKEGPEVDRFDDLPRLRVAILAKEIEVLLHGAGNVAEG